jgi:hypothetical protein
MDITIRPNGQRTDVWTFAVDGRVWGTFSSLNAILNLAVNAAEVAVQHGEDVIIDVRHASDEVSA